MEIRFLGAAQEVTGSCHLLRVQGRTILVDCGLIQGAPDDEARNRNPFPFDPAAIHAVVLTHAHLDHSGRLPLLIKNGFDGPVYTHRASRDLCRIMLKDAGYINEKETEWENRKRERRHLPPIEPLYTVQDAQVAMRQFKPLEYHVDTTIAPGVTIRLRDAGHILGSAIVEMWLSDGHTKRKLVFSGDLGHKNAPVLRDPELVDSADLVVLESTYGERLHRPWADTWRELQSIFNDSVPGRGNILIPAFAVGRTQDLLHTLRRYYDDWHIKDWQVFLDSPMAIEATEVYTRYPALYDAETRESCRKGRNPFTLPNLHISRTANQSMQINRVASGAVIIAGSGMCDGGRIKHHLKHNVWRSNCQIVMVGFQAQGTLGRRLVEGAKEISLWGEPVRVSARVHTVGGLSAHADRDGLVGWLRAFHNAPHVALVHGEHGAIDALALHLRERHHYRVHTPMNGDVLDLTTLR